MKIVAICGSPHKGSCYSMLSTLADNHPEIDYKLIMLGELDLKPCRGCYACIARGEEKCPLRDDRDLVQLTGSRLEYGATLSREQMIMLAVMSSENRAAAALGQVGGALQDPPGRPALGLGHQVAGPEDQFLGPLDVFLDLLPALGLGPGGLGGGQERQPQQRGDEEFQMSGGDGHDAPLRVVGIRGATWMHPTGCRARASPRKWARRRK